MAEFYALCSTEAALTALSETNLTLEPHPNTYTEESETHTAGDGQLTGVGFPSAEWTWDVFLSPSEWDELMSVIGTAASVIAYIRTRTNQISAGAYEHANFSCVMHRPQGDSAPYFRFSNVSVKFTKLVLLT